jgi:hypothetical protein
MAGEWVLPEKVKPGANVGLVLAWYPHPQVEYNDVYPWHEGDPPPEPPGDFVFGEWRPSPHYETYMVMRHYKVVPAVAGLFSEGDYVRFYARGTDWLVPKGTPHIVMLFDGTQLHSPHEPPARLR